jgi:LacI family transcriptional regulator
MDENTEQVGATAVDVLVEMMHRGERGVPRVPTCHLVEAIWMPGSTVRAIHRGAVHSGAT